jgi:hypothetical protein
LSIASIERNRSIGTGCGPIVDGIRRRPSSVVRRAWSTVRPSWRWWNATKRSGDHA